MQSINLVKLRMSARGKNFVISNNSLASAALDSDYHFFIANATTSHFECVGPIVSVHVNWFCSNHSNSNQTSKQK